MNRLRHITLLGFGEVGGILGTDLAGQGLELTAFDLAFEDPQSGPARAVRDHSEIVAADNAAEAVRNCDLIISAVTPAQDLAAAESVAAAMAPGTLFLDLNSVAPDVRRRVAEVVERADGRYVEGAVMAPVAPKRLGSPVLLGGPHAQVFLPAATALGFSDMRVYSAEVGRAAAVKMCRSVIVKGVEALISESLLAARYHGVEAEITATLESLFPRPDWPAHAHYLISRTLQHGARRAEEMQQVAETVRQAGITPWMSDASRHRQAWAHHFAWALEHETLEALLDAILESLTAPSGGMME